MVSKISEQLAATKNENQRLEVKLVDAENQLSSTGHELRRMRKQVEMLEYKTSLSAKRGWFSGLAGEGKDDESMEAAQWRETASANAEKLAEVERDMDQLKLVLARLNDERQENLRMSPIRGGRAAAADL